MVVWLKRIYLTEEFFFVELLDSLTEKFAELSKLLAESGAGIFLPEIVA